MTRKRLVGRPLFVGARLFACEKPMDARSFASLSYRAIPPEGPFFILRFRKDREPPFARVTSAGEMESFLPWWEERFPQKRVGDSSEVPDRRFGYEERDQLLSLPLDYAPRGFEWSGSKHPGLSNFTNLSADLHHGIGYVSLELGCLLVSDTYGLRDVDLLNAYMEDLTQVTKRLVAECRPQFAFVGEDRLPNRDLVKVYKEERALPYFYWATYFGPAFLERLGADFLTGLHPFSIQGLAGGSWCQLSRCFVFDQRAEGPDEATVRSYLRKHPLGSGSKYRHVTAGAVLRSSPPPW